MRQLSRPHWTSLALIGAVMLQGALWWHSRDLRQPYVPLPPAPSQRAVEALSFGDHQALFRAMAVTVQNMGEGDGRVTPIREMDYVRLTDWFRLLDRLDSRSDFAPAVAGYLFGQTAVAEDARRIAWYLHEHATRDLPDKWRWLLQSAHIAKYRARDLPLAFELSKPLTTLPPEAAPGWVRQYPAFLLARAGERESARILLKAVVESDPRLSTQEKLYVIKELRERPPELPRLGSPPSNE